MPTRRQLLGAGAALVMAPLASCGADEEPLPPGAVKLALAGIPDGQRTVVMRAAEPVELMRTGARITARSLWCTHFGCRLSWDGAAHRYNCPCHGGAFDADGRPIAGPPTEPMRVLPTRTVQDSVIVYPLPRRGQRPG